MNGQMATNTEHLSSGETSGWPAAQAQPAGQMIDELDSLLMAPLGNYLQALQETSSLDGVLPLAGSLDGDDGELLPPNDAVGQKRKAIPESSSSEARLAANSQAQKRYRNRLKNEKENQQQKMEEMGSLLKELAQQNKVLSARVSMMEAAQKVTLAAITQEPLGGSSYEATPRHFERGYGRISEGLGSEQIDGAEGAEQISGVMSALERIQGVTAARINALLVNVPKGEEADAETGSLLLQELHSYVSQKTRSKSRMNAAQQMALLTLRSSHIPDIDQTLLHNLKELLVPLQAMPERVARMVAHRESHLAAMRKINLQRQSCNKEVIALMKRGEPGQGGDDVSTRPCAPRQLDWTGVLLCCSFAVLCFSCCLRECCSFAVLCLLATLLLL